ncbi:MAG: alpha/beta fold hydrolase [Mycobacterium sp.]
MSMKSARQCAADGSSWHRWLRLAIVAFIIAGYLIVAVGTGAARADDHPSGPGGEASAPSASSASSTPAPASGIERPSGTPNPTTSTTTDTTTTATTAVTVDAESPSGTNTPENQPPGVVDPGTVDAVQVTGTIAPTTPATETTETVAPAKIVAPTQTVAPEQDSSSAPTAGGATPDPTTAAAVSPDPSTSSVAPKTSIPAQPHRVDPKPLTAIESAASEREATGTSTARGILGGAGAVPLAAVSDPAPSVVSTNPPPLPALNPVQFGRQMAGLISDVGIVAISAVHTVATTVAQAFGPDSFLGVPYLLATSLANVAAAAGRTLIGGPFADSFTGPFPVTYGVLDGLAFFNPTKPPAGANDPAIKVTPEHPLPVILLNGTTATQGTNFSVGAAVLANAGYKVYTFNYGNTTPFPNSPIQAIGDIRQSGQELAAEVDRVLAETGAPRVILVGHSQGGGILPAYYINNLDGAGKVSQLIGIAPSNHGTDIDSLMVLQALPIFGPLAVAISNVIGPALYQQALGSPFQQEVYGNGDTRPGVLYTTIASINDEVVTPYTQQALTGPNVTNIVLQDQYPGLIVGHAGIIVSPHVWATVLGALAANPAANPANTTTALAA